MENIVNHMLCGVHRLVILESLPRSGESWGEYSPWKSIHVKEGLSHRERLQTIFHEYLHHLDEAYGLKLGETKVRALEQLLLNSIRENPAFFTQLLQEFKDPDGQ